MPNLQADSYFRFVSQGIAGRVHQLNEGRFVQPVAVLELHVKSPISKKMEVWAVFFRDPKSLIGIEVGHQVQVTGYVDRSLGGHGVYTQPVSVFLWGETWERLAH